MTKKKKSSKERNIYPWKKPSTYRRNSNRRRWIFFVCLFTYKGSTYAISLQFNLLSNNILRKMNIAHIIWSHTFTTFYFTSLAIAMEIMLTLDWTENNSNPFSISIFGPKFDLQRPEKIKKGFTRRKNGILKEHPTACGTQINWKHNSTKKKRLIKYNICTSSLLGSVFQTRTEHTFVVYKWF